MASMYYSSESSDSDSIRDKKSLDLSYLMLDSESLSSYLKNSVREQHYQQQMKLVDSSPGCTSSNYLFSSSDIDLDDVNLSSDADDGASWQEKSRLEHKMETLSSEAVGNVLDEPITEPSTSSGSVDSLQLRTIKLAINKARRVSESDGEGDGAFTQDDITEKLYLNHNLIIHIPFELVLFHKLKFVDLSNNNLSHLNDFILQLPELQTLYVKNNQLDDESLPKDMSSMTKIREINLSGNLLTLVPPQLYEVTSLRYLYLGNNTITEVGPEVRALQNLQVLHLGGNRLTSVPEELGELSHLCALVLSNNRLRKLPRAISRLHKLRSLLLHTNNFCCLPVEIIKLRSLDELSLRDNPLVTNFVNCCIKELMYNPPSLKELAARTVRLQRIPYKEMDLPLSLHNYLSSSHKCVNPKCKGVYFTSCVEHIKFVDFCGMYRVPLMHYLCSSRCTSQTPSSYLNRAGGFSHSDDSDDDVAKDNTMRRVLLG